jgi:lysophospholipase L1-like esterase
VEIDWYMQINGPVAGSARSLIKTIEYPVGVFHPVTWGGNVQLDLPGTFTKVVSDIVISSVTGLPLLIPAVAMYRERTFNVTSIANMPTRILPAAANVLGCSDGNTASNALNSGTIGPTTGTRTFGSVAIIGDILAANARSVVIAGDSLVWGQGDATSLGANQSSGWWERLMSAAGVSTLKLAMPGITTGGFVSSLTVIADLLSVIPFSEGECELGLNDLTSGVSVATILANHQTIYGLFAGKPITQDTITTRTDSNNAYADAAGQAVKTDGNMAGLNPLNDQIRAIPANVTRVRDVADADMTARNSGIHAGPFPPVGDGTHFFSPKAADIASKLVA